MKVNFLGSYNANISTVVNREYSFNGSLETSSGKLLSSVSVSLNFLNLNLILKDGLFQNVSHVVSGKYKSSLGFQNSTYLYQYEESFSYPLRVSFLVNTFSGISQENLID